MFEPLKNFLIRNGLTQELVEEELYDYLMLGVLDKVASSLKNENTRNCALNLYRGLGFPQNSIHGVKIIAVKSLFVLFGALIPQRGMHPFPVVVDFDVLEDLPLGLPLV